MEDSKHRYQDKFCGLRSGGVSSTTARTVVTMPVPSLRLES